MNRRNQLARIVPWLLAVLFLATQLSAIAHEFEHALQQHDEPCALHVAADQPAKVHVGTAISAPAAARDNGQAPPAYGSARTIFSRANAARAPPPSP